MYPECCRSSWNLPGNYNVVYLFLIGDWGRGCIWYSVTCLSVLHNKNQFLRHFIGSTEFGAAVGFPKRVCMYVCGVYVCMYMSLCVNVYMHVCVWGMCMCLCVLVYVYMFVCGCEFVWICMYIHVWNIYMCLCECMWICVYICVNMYVCVYVCGAYVHIFVCECMSIYVCEYVRWGTSMHMCVRRFARMCLCVCVSLLPLGARRGPQRYLRS